MGFRWGDNPDELGSRYNLGKGTFQQVIRDGLISNLCGGILYCRMNGTPLRKFALVNKNGTDGFLNFMNIHRQKFTGRIQKSLSPNRGYIRRGGKKR
jgi:hypothetical protein